MAHARAGEIAVAGAGPVVADRPAGAGGEQIPARALAEGLTPVAHHVIEALADAQRGAGFQGALPLGQVDAGVRDQRHLEPRGRLAPRPGPAAAVVERQLLVLERAGEGPGGRKGRAVGATPLAATGQPQPVDEALADQIGLARPHGLEPAVRREVQRGQGFQRRPERGVETHGVGGLDIDPHDQVADRIIAAADPAGGVRPGVVEQVRKPRRAGEVGASAVSLLGRRRRSRHKGRSTSHKCRNHGAHSVSPSVSVRAD